MARKTTAQRPARAPKPAPGRKPAISVQVVGKPTCANALASVLLKLHDQPTVRAA